MTPRRIFIACCALLPPLLACGTAETYAPQPFEHYQPILDRMPFGPLPPNFGEVAAEPTKTDAQVQAEQQKLAKQINMSCINVTPGGKTAIGFTDLNEKPPQNYYLLVGDSGGGWTVVNADYDDEWAQIEKDGVTITLKLGKGLIDAPPTAVATAVAPDKPAPAPAPAAAPEGLPAPPALGVPAPPRAGVVKAPSLLGRPPLDLSGLKRTQQETEQMRADMEKLQASGGDVVSYVERLRERREKEKAQAAVAEKTAQDKLKELARQITQEELIRQGVQPLQEGEAAPEAPQPAADVIQ